MGFTVSCGARASHCSGFSLQGTGSRACSCGFLSCGVGLLEKTNYGDWRKKSMVVRDYKWKESDYKEIKQRSFWVPFLYWASLIAQLAKNLLAMQEVLFNSWVRKICWRKEKLSTPVFGPGQFHGLYSPWGLKESDMNEWLSLHLLYWYLHESIYVSNFIELYTPQIS